MEYYESKCSQCGHKWHWVGFKTTLGKTPDQIEKMKTAGTKCPQCQGTAEVGLDHSSPEAQALDNSLSSLLKGIFQK